jgi:hypothetical protein
MRMAGIGNTVMEAAPTLMMYRNTREWGGCKSGSEGRVGQNDSVGRVLPLDEAQMLDLDHVRVGGKLVTNKRLVLFVSALHVRESCHGTCTVTCIVVN